MVGDTPAKTETPIVGASPRNSISVRRLQPTKAYSLISVTLSGITTRVILLQSLNAFGPI